ncbi:MAG: lipocalin family protein [Bacteroidaceae bacterium]|nr:lipocalin family protein [Bacteroidaceae bacterium]
MKKLLFLFAMLPILVFTACSDDDKDDVKLTTEQVVGKWNVTWAQQGNESLDISSGSIYMSLKSDGTYRTVMFDDYYIGEWKLEGNTVVGTTTDPITERYTFTSLDGNNAEIDYSNSEGDKMKFRATKVKDSGDEEVNYEQIIGTWTETSYTEGEYVSSKIELSWTFRSDKTATQRIVLYINNINTKDVSVDFTYVYNGREIITKHSSGEETTHEVSISGNKMTLGDGEGGYFNLTKK